MKPLSNWYFFYLLPISRLLNFQESNSQYENLGRIWRLSGLLQSLPEYVLHVLTGSSQTWLGTEDNDTRNLETQKAEKRFPAPVQMNRGQRPTSVFSNSHNWGSQEMQNIPVYDENANLF